MNKNLTTQQDQCRCGCEQQVGATSTYRPGHDARHAGIVGRQVAELLVSKHAYVSADDVPQPEADEFAKMPSLPLKYKARYVARNILEKEERKATRMEARKAKKADKVETTELDPIKVGRWTYPARERDGVTERNTKRDGSGEWVVVK